MSLLLISLYSPTLHAANIIFDLGGVLITTKYMKSVLSVGPLKMISYALTLQNPFASYKKMYGLLNVIKPLALTTYTVRDSHGIPLPALMVDWLCGTISHTELLQIIHQNLDYANNWIERLLIQSLAKTIFCPETFARTRAIVPEGVEFVKKCKAQGHKLYILSNWDPDSFKVLQELYPTFFALFDGIVISGNEGAAKPNPAIYHALLQKYQLDIKDCIVIDDQAENIAAAHNLGIATIHYSDKASLIFTVPNFDYVQQELDPLLIPKDF